MKESKCNLVISGIVKRKKILQKEINEVNGILKDNCNKRNIGFIAHDNINPIYHCNKRGLHLKKNGSSILSDNFVDVIDSLDSNN